MRATLLLLVLTLLPLGGSAKERPILVYDATGRDPSVTAEIQDYRQAGVPLRAIGREASCAQARRAAPESAIVLCVRELGAGLDGLTTFCRGCQTVVRIRPGALYTRNICHELMHALTHIRDDYSNPMGDRSCVWGSSSHLGAFDKKYLQHHLIRP